MIKTWAQCATLTHNIAGKVAKVRLFSTSAKLHATNDIMSHSLQHCMQSSTVPVIALQGKKKKNTF